MVNLTRIYTRTGDAGQTRLGDMSLTSKLDLRLQAYADVDELNSNLGVVLAAGDLDDEVCAVLRRVQNELFDVGADLSTPVVPDPPYEPLRVLEEYVARLEQACDRWNEELEPLRSFILPGGTAGAAYLHVATTVVRRAERSAWAAIAAHGDQPGTEKGTGGVNRLTATYLNRLSDLLFILARVANVERGGDVLWQPGGGRVQQPERKRRT